MATQFSICLWGQNAKGMAQYYQEVFNDFKLVSENPMAVVFEMIGKRFMCLNNCTPNLNFNEKISFVLTVDTQDECMQGRRVRSSYGQKDQAKFTKKM